MNEITKIGGKLSAKVNLGDYNSAELTLWIEDRVRPEDGSTSSAIDRVVGLLDVKLGQWSEGLKDD